VAKMGEMAAKLVLKDVYQQKNIEINRVFEPTLMKRDSTTQLITN
jgi:LacI family transcriptional regulator